jgi:hypothetical protein
MSKTKKNRKGPAESATIFPVGTTKRGNDGNAWKIIKTDSGVHRWAKIGSNRTVKNKSEIKQGTENNITLSRLKQLGQKNNVLTSGKSKSGIAQLLFNICGSALSTDDLQEIHTLLPSKSKKEALRMIETQLKNPISNYKGMWKPAPKPIREMSRNEMIHNLRKFRDAWEKNMGRNQDLSDERLAEETDKSLRNHLEYYYSETAKNQAANWIRDDS